MHRRWRLRLAAYFLLLIVVGVVVAWQWTRMDPSWYRPPDPGQVQVQNSAQGMEMRLMEEAHQIRPVEEDWTEEVEEAEANAWLAARLGDWLANRGRRWPDELGLPQVKFEENLISVALDAGPHTGGRVITARVQPEMVEGRLRFQLDGVGIGRVPVPGDPAEKLLELARRFGPDDSEGMEAISEIMDVLTGRTSVDPVFELADGRRVRLRDLRSSDGRVGLTSRTLGRADDEPDG
ncbi:MAG: hypothetical protein JSV91_02555 [Phycisphaerales bacterium]|nr:MAG: hypothetical protein JSV91_02555 [Phycisphaerales bacterium]